MGYILGVITGLAIGLIVHSWNNLKILEKQREKIEHEMEMMDLRWKIRSDVIEEIEDSKKANKKKNGK